MLIREHGRVRTRAVELLDVIEVRHVLLSSRESLGEVSRVLRYPRFQELYGLSDERIFAYHQRLASVSEMIDLDPIYTAPLRDPNDLAILQTADVGRADLLVTADPDFYDAPVLDFCKSRGIDVCTEEMALRRLR